MDGDPETRDRDYDIRVITKAIEGLKNLTDAIYDLDDMRSTPGKTAYTIYISHTRKHYHKMIDNMEYALEYIAVYEEVNERMPSSVDILANGKGAE